MRAIAVLTIAGFFIAGQAVPAQPATWLEQKLKEVDRNICQTYQSVKCKHRRKAAPLRKVAKKPAAIDATAEKKPSAGEEVADKRAETQPAKGADEAAVVPKPRAKPAVAAVPVPEEKPAEIKSTVIAKSPPPMDEVTEPEPDAPPAPKADMAEPPLAIPPPKPREKPKLTAKVAVIVPREPSQAEAAEPKTGSCLSQLAARGVKFNVVTKSVGQGACQVKDPVQLVAQKVDDNTVTFPDQPTLNCAFALEFARWMSERGEPIASAAGTHVSKFYTGPGYQCRGRNGDSSAKISEHGYGNAIDIERMQMADGKVYLVEDVRSLFKPGAGTMKKMRASACDYFTTVLGPGANAAHEKHFHFDMGKHGRSGTYKICE